MSSHFFHFHERLLTAHIKLLYFQQMVVQWPGNAKTVKIACLKRNVTLLEGNTNKLRFIFGVVITKCDMCVLRSL